MIYKYQVYITKKNCNIISVDIEAENKEKANKIILDKDFDFSENDYEYIDYLYETLETAEMQDNNLNSTIEIYDEENNFICDNSLNSNKNYINK